MTSTEPASANPFLQVLRIAVAVKPNDKYKAKNFIDTIVYRTGDQIGAWTTPALSWLGLGLRGVSLVAAPMAAVWLVISLWLGRRQAHRARQAAVKLE